MGLIYLKNEGAADVDAPSATVLDFYLSGAVNIVLGANTFTKGGTYTLVTWTRNLITVPGYTLTVSMSSGPLRVLSTNLNTTTKTFSVTIGN